jgi:hypothetical protein
MEDAAARIEAALGSPSALSSTPAPLHASRSRSGLLAAAAALKDEKRSEQERAALAAVTARIAAAARSAPRPPSAHAE